MPYSDIKQQREAQKLWARKNKDRVYAKTQQCREIRKQKLRILKEASPCLDCDKFYPYYVMQYDHVVGDKVDKVSSLVSNSAWERVEAEISKCDLVCGNCHAIRTYKRSLRE